MKNLIISILVQFILFVVFYFALESKKERIAFVDLNKLYDNFEFKKDLESKYKNLESKRKGVLDSMELSLKILTANLEKKRDENLMNDYELKKERYFITKQQFQEDNQATMNQYHEQIISRLNEYVKEYGKVNKLTYLLGNDGGGSVLYGDEIKNVTEDVIKFINKGYKRH